MSTSKASDIYFAGARATGRLAENEPDPRERVRLYMHMIESDVKAAEAAAWEAQIEDKAGGWAR